MQKSQSIIGRDSLSAFGREKHQKMCPEFLFFRHVFDIFSQKPQLLSKGCLDVNGFYWQLGLF